ncbi:MAG TPA: accessory factor UbiK family protein [Hyphomicrobiales bacterium]|nr:accessory factor UbiK family protein [Hyphomicrobiales bacterium]
MIDNDFLRSLSTKAAALFPAASEAREKIEQELFTLLKSALGPLNLLSRDEFETQMQVLTQAEARISELERRVAELERLPPEAEE